jgi:hypothetical protein
MSGFLEKHNIKDDAGIPIYFTEWTIHFLA